MAVASLVCSLVGIVIGLGAILGVTFGFMSRNRIKASAGAKTGAGLALAGIIVGIVALVLNVTLAAILLAHRSSTSPPATAAAFGGNPTAADATLARSEALPASAYPGGYTAQGASSTNPSGGFFGGYTDAQVHTLAACIGTSTTNVDSNPAEYAGQKYMSQDGASIIENVEVYPTTQEALADVTAMANPRAGECWLHLNSDVGSSIASGIGNGATAGTATANAIDLPGIGDHAAGVQAVIPLTVQGAPVTAYIDFVAIQKGRSEAVLIMTAGGGGSGAQDLTGLEQAAAAHLAS